MRQVFADIEPAETYFYVTKIIGKLVKAGLLEFFNPFDTAGKGDWLRVTPEGRAEAAAPDPDAH